MSAIEIIMMAVALAMDACAVSVALSAAGLVDGRRAAFRLSFHFGLFQFLMPVAGWSLGTRVAGHVAAVDHWIAFGLLAIIGGRMLRSSGQGSSGGAGDPTRGLTLLSLSLATSIDAFAVGLSLAMIRVTIWYPSLVIGLVAALLSLAGLALGDRLGTRFGRRVELLGGLILIAIGGEILATHLAGS